MALMDECMIFLTRQTIVCGELVTVHSLDGRRWFSSKKDIRRFEAKADQAGESPDGEAITARCDVGTVLI
jgi:hypothetical protein